MKPNEDVPLVRLLDLIIGWAQYVEQHHDDSLDAELNSDDLYELYQEAGQLMSETTSREEAERRVRSFVEQRLLPTLLEGRTNKTSELPVLKAA